MTEKLKIVDLFAGVGGIRLGFEQAFPGIECVFTSEINKYPQLTYTANFGGEVHGDITRIEAGDIPAHDVLLAGFPCQPFSVAGLRQGFEDTRGTLFFEIERILAHHKPRVVFLENVKGFVGHDKGNTFRVVMDRLAALGYKTHHQVLNAKDFGVPQNRERIYIVGFLDDVVFKFPEPPKTPTRLGDVLDTDVPEKYTISDRLWAGHQRRKAEHRSKGNGFGYSMFNADSAYTSTISSRYYKDGSEILIEQENANPRKITPREASRLQGFPEEFKLVVSDVQAYKQFGNSVCVPVIKAIAMNIAASLQYQIDFTSTEYPEDFKVMKANIMKGEGGG